MCLLITLFAAVITTIVWYLQLPNNCYKISTLVFMYWGASLMCLVDGFFCMTEGKPFFDLSLNNASLGFTIVVSGLIAWVIIFLIKGDKINRDRAILSQK